MPVDVIPLKLSWHGKVLPTVHLTFQLGAEIRETSTLLAPVALSGDAGVLKVTAVDGASGRRGKAWIPLQDYNPGCSDTEYIPLVDGAGSPVADLHLIIVLKPRSRPEPNIVRYDPTRDPTSRVYEPPPVFSPPPFPPASSLPPAPAPPMWGAPPQMPLTARGPDPYSGVAALYRPLATQPPLRPAFGNIQTVDVVVREVRHLRQAGAPLLVEARVLGHVDHTHPRPQRPDGVAAWDEGFLLGVAPEDDLVLTLKTDQGAVVGTTVLPGERLMRHKAHDVLVNLEDGRGHIVGALLISVGGGALHANVGFPVGARHLNMSQDQWLHTLGDRNQQLTHRPLRKPTNAALMVAAANGHVIPAPPPQNSLPLQATPPPPPGPLDRVTVDRSVRRGPVTTQRPFTGRGLCIRIHQVRGRDTTGLFLQIQDDQVTQQASVADALNAFFTLDTVPEESIVFRLRQRETVVANGRVPSSALLQSSGPVEIQLFAAEGAVDCSLIVERLEDGPLGYAFGSREEFLAAPAPMVLQ